MTPQITTHPRAWQAGYADGLAGRPHGTDPLSQVDELAYASGYVEGKAAKETSDA
jgi:ribosome modulation factor